VKRRVNRLRFRKEWLSISASARGREEHSTRKSIMDAMGLRVLFLIIAFVQFIAAIGLLVLNTDFDERKVAGIIIGLPIAGSIALVAAAIVKDNNSGR